MLGLPGWPTPQGGIGPVSVSLERRSRGTGPFLQLLVATFPAGDHTPGTRHGMLHGLPGVPLCRRHRRRVRAQRYCPPSESQALALLRTAGRADLSASESRGRESGGRAGSLCWGGEPLIVPGAQVPPRLGMHPPVHLGDPEGFRDTRPSLGPQPLLMVGPDPQTSSVSAWGRGRG